MPFNPYLKAKTSSDASSGLHCFIPSIVAIFNEGTHIEEKDRLAAHFKDYYKIETHFTRDTLRAILQNTQDPIEREALLSPVLRQMMINKIRHSNFAFDKNKSKDEYIASLSDTKTPVQATDLLYLADDLGILLYAYDSINNAVDILASRKESEALPAKSYAKTHILNIRNENMHWEFERDWHKHSLENKRLLEEHNTKYQANLRQFNTEILRNRIKTEVEAGRTRLSSVFVEPEVLYKPVVNNTFTNLISGFKNAVAGIGTGIKDTFNNVRTSIGKTIQNMSFLGNFNSVLKNTPFADVAKTGGFMKNLFQGFHKTANQNQGILGGLLQLLLNFLNPLLNLFGLTNHKAESKKTPKPLARPRPVPKKKLHDENDEIGVRRAQNHKLNGKVGARVESEVVKQLRDLLNGFNSLPNLLGLDVLSQNAGAEFFNAQFTGHQKLRQGNSHNSNGIRTNPQPQPSVLTPMFSQFQAGHSPKIHSAPDKNVRNNHNHL